MCLALCRGSRAGSFARQLWWAFLSRTATMRAVAAVQARHCLTNVPHPGHISSVHSLQTPRSLTGPLAGAAPPTAPSYGLDPRLTIPRWGPGGTEGAQGIHPRLPRGPLTSRRAQGACEPGTVSMSGRAGGSREECFGERSCTGQPLGDSWCVGGSEIPQRRPLWMLMGAAGVTKTVAEADPGAGGAAASLEGLWAPVRGMVDVVSGLQSTTGLPWWATICLTAVGIRALLFPLALQQSKCAAYVPILSRNLRAKGGHVGSRGSLKTVLADLKAIGKKLGLPHPIWFLASPIVQIPVFVSTIWAVRHMALSGWPGMSHGGTLWFPDLTEGALSLAPLSIPMGLAGLLLPGAVTFFLQANIKYSYGRLSLQAPGVGQGRLVALIRVGMEWLTVFTLLASLQLPQGAVLYWVASSSSALAQGFFLRQSAAAFMKQTELRRALGLAPAPGSQHQSPRDPLPLVGPDASTHDLFALAAHKRASGDVEGALGLLESILSREPQNARAWRAAGLLHSLRLHWDQAELAFLAATRFCSQREPLLLARSWIGAGVAQFKQADAQAAAQSFGRAVEVLHPIITLSAKAGRAGVPTSNLVQGPNGDPNSHPHANPQRLDVEKPRLSQSEVLPDQQLPDELRKLEQQLPDEVQKAEQQLPDEMQKLEEQLPDELQKLEQQLPDELQKLEEQLPDELHKLEQQLPDELQKLEQQLPDELQKNRKEAAGGGGGVSEGEASGELTPRGPGGTRAGVEEGQYIEEVRRLLVQARLSQASALKEAGKPEEALEAVEEAAALDPSLAKTHLDPLREEVRRDSL
eukprot:jgi/Botrbrau1/3039/Bobra.0070s0035.1